MIRNLYRTRDGVRIHTANCYRRNALTNLPWLWAQDKATHELWAAVNHLGLKPCLTCKPLGEPSADSTDYDPTDAEQGPLERGWAESRRHDRTAARG